MSDNKELLQEKVLGQFTQYDINTLKQTLAASLNSAEFGLFLNTCVATGLNPFLKQVIPVVYEGKNGRRFDIQVPVEGIEHLAREKEGWGGYELQLVCENDGFKAKRDKESGAWIIEDHEIAFPRGKTMGAYCIVPRKGFKDVVIFMEISEVSHLLEDFRAKAMWGKWFNDMFKKHIKKRALREQFGIEIDDMQDLNSGPERYENNIPSYQPQERQQIQQEEYEPGFDEDKEVQNIWDKISKLMEQFSIDKQEAIQISKRRFNGRDPYDLNNQELAAFMKFVELEGQVKKAQEQKEEKQQQANKMEQHEAKEVEVIQQEPEQQTKPQQPKNELDSFLEDLDSMFNKDGQGELF
jgi:recombination protein RecT